MTLPFEIRRVRIWARVVVAGAILQGGTGSTSAQSLVARSRLNATGLSNVGMAADSRGFYVASGTAVWKYDFSGRELWNRQLGAQALIGSLSSDAIGIYVYGLTRADLPGQQGPGAPDYFLRRYDSDGTELWTKQFGTPLSEEPIGAVISADDEGVYAAGFQGHSPQGQGRSFLRRFDRSGNELWIQIFPVSYIVQRLAASAGGVYVAGGAIISRNTGSYFAPFVSRYDSLGSELWIHREFDRAASPTGIAADPTGAYLFAFGAPGGSAGSGGGTILRKYGIDGAIQWSRTSDHLSAGIVVADGSSVYVVSNTSGTLPGQCSAGLTDVTVQRYDIDGTEIWTRQFGTYLSDFLLGAVASAGSVFVAVNSTDFDNETSSLTQIEHASLPPRSSAPWIRAECVLNAASFIGGAVSPGQIVTVLGNNIGPPSPVQASPGNDRYPASLAETRVLFNGVAGPVLYASGSQVNAIVPYSTAPGDSVAVRVEYQGVQSEAVVLPALAMRPGIFRDRGGRAVVLNENGTVNSRDNPAAAGSTITFYATGLGPTDPESTDGQVFGAAPPRLKAQTSVALFDSSEELTAMEVLYSGGMPGNVSGIVQVRTRLPRQLREGAFGLILHGGRGPDTVSDIAPISIR